MKQILQSLKTGATTIADVPCPAVQRGQLLIRSTHTLISAGTERMLVEFGKAGWIDKARQQPDKVRMVLDKIKTDGLLPTIETVFNKLDQPLPLGYCNVGVVLETGSGVTGFAPGDRVVSNGKHAEVVSVPVNLCAKVPDAVSDAEAAFTVLGAIALQGIRLVGPTLARVAGGTLVLPGVDGQSGRSITIQPFALALQPVTFADYDLFARQTDRSPPYDGGLRPEERAIHPVTSITWYEAQAYVEWLSQRTGQRYRLPSEAEWLYARQAGVGNRDGIAREWVADCAGNGPTALPRHQAPRGQEDGGDCGRRVLRGESASNGEPQSTDRGGLDIGFRVARELNPAETRP